MTVVARMRFKSVEKPAEYGALVLNDDGTLQVVPSDEFRDEMARLEEVALHRSQTYGTRTGLILIGLGTLALVAGWLVGRIFGKLGSTLSAARPVQDVTLTREEGGGLRLTLKGMESRLQLIQMAWNADEILQPEVDEFIKKFEEMQEH